MITTSSIHTFWKLWCTRGRFSPIKNHFIVDQAEMISVIDCISGSKEGVTKSGRFGAGSSMNICNHQDIGATAMRMTVQLRPHEMLQALSALEYDE